METKDGIFSEIILFPFSYIEIEEIPLNMDVESKIAPQIAILTYEVAWDRILTIESLMKRDNERLTSASCIMMRMRSLTLFFFIIQKQDDFGQLNH